MDQILISKTGIMIHRNNPKVQFSEITTTGELPKSPNKASVCAACLNDWGLVMAGNKQPANFGKGITEASQLLGITGDPDSFMEWANEFLK